MKNMNRRTAIASILALPLVIKSAALAACSKRTSTIKPWMTPPWTEPRSPFPPHTPPCFLQNRPVYGKDTRKLGLTTPKGSDIEYYLVYRGDGKHWDRIEVWPNRQTPTASYPYFYSRLTNSEMMHEWDWNADRWEELAGPMRFEIKGRRVTREECRKLTYEYSESLIKHYMKGEWS